MWLDTLIESGYELVDKDLPERVVKNVNRARIFMQNDVI